MLIALLAVLGVDLIVIVAVLAVVLARRLWVLEADGDARIAIGVASNGDRALGSFAAAGDKTSVAE